MDFSVNDGVRLVRSLTDKVRSAMSTFLVKTDNDLCNPAWDEEEGLQYQDSDDSNPQLQQVLSLPRQRKVRPQATLVNENETELSQCVDDLVKNRSKLREANLISENDVDGILKGLEHDKTGFANLIASHDVNDIDLLRGFEHGSKSRFVEHNIKQYVEDRHKNNTRNVNKETREGNALVCGRIRDSENHEMFTNDDLKLLGVDYINREDILPLSDKLDQTAAAKIKQEVKSIGNREMVSKEPSEHKETESRPISGNADKIYNSFMAKISKTMDENLVESRSISNKTDEALNEFENDILYLSGCKHKTSTPEKDSSLGVSKEQINYKSPEFKHPDEPAISPSRYVRRISPSRCERRISPNSSPYRRNLRPISPLVRSSIMHKTDATLNRKLGQFDGAIAKSRNSSFNQAGVTRFCNNTDEFGHVTDAQAGYFPQKSQPANLISDFVYKKSLVNISPASEKWVAAARIVQSKQTARRSLFNEQSTLSRYLPLTHTRTDKPLGYEAYRQFMTVSKSDILPKYFFENEDEEAVYYLKTKYLDDAK